MPEKDTANKVTDDHLTTLQVRDDGSEAQADIERKDTDMPFKTGKALFYAVLLWVIGFVWGSFVFMTPALKTVSAIPYISSNPAVSFPILFIWLTVTYLLAKSYLKTSGGKADAG
jgi:hypothetical protein